MKADVSDVSSLSLAFDTVSKLTSHLDIIVNNAGVASSSHPSNPILSLDTEEFLTMLSTNTVGPLRVLQKFSSLLEKSEGERKLAVNISSSLGSISNNTTGGVTAYRSSKAAVNQITKVRGSGYILCE